MGLQISIRESADVTILDLQGRVTIGVDGDVLNVRLKELLAKGARKLLLNLEDETQLLCPCGRVQDVLQVMHVAEFIPTFEDETQALASFRPQGYARKP